MNLAELGYTGELEKLRTENGLENFEPGRVIAEHKERYTVKTVSGDLEAEITGNMRFTASGREDFPAVGDWVALTVVDPDYALIHKIYPRYSVLKRKAVGKQGEVQVIAANIDYAFIVQAANRDFNLNRLERYLAVCYAGKVSPVILISKTDLYEEQHIGEIIQNIKKRMDNIPVLAISNTTGAGFDAIRKIIQKGKTYCMLGSSGVGKSTLINNLSGRTIMETGAISGSTHKGRHVTSHRELVVLENGGILIDNPGMREIGLTDASGGLEIAFDEIWRFAQNCRYKDCTHTGESGCAVTGALQDGEIDRAAYENFMKMQKEKSHFETSVAEKRKKDKELGKIIRNYKKDKKRNNL